LNRDKVITLGKELRCSKKKGGKGGKKGKKGKERKQKTKRTRENPHK
jgi:hypothetical protein